MKIAILSITSGKVERGAEYVAWLFKTRLPFEIKVFSNHESEWTEKVEIKRNMLWTKVVNSIRNTIIFKFVYQIEKLIPKLYIFEPWFFDHKSYSQNLTGSLDKFCPDLILNLSGPVVNYYMKQYSTGHNIPLMTIGTGGKGLLEIKNAQSCPTVYCVQTPFWKKFIEERVPGLRVELVPNGADLRPLNELSDKFGNEELIARNLTGEKAVIEYPVILATAALEKEKRLDYLINAVSKLSKGTLIFTSSGSKKDMLISLGKGKLKNRFVYLGILEKEEMYKIYNTCDIFCMPAVNEAFGTIIIEAMAANKPVVVNDEEDRHWMINDAGVFTDMADVNKIAESLLKAYNINWGNKPRLQAEKFSWDIIFSKYNSLILELIQQKKKGFNQ